MYASVRFGRPRTMLAKVRRIAPLEKKCEEGHRHGPLWGPRASSLEASGTRSNGDEDYR